ncbi:MAG: hydroxyisourate hydrolase [Acidobacteriota bacterium]
MNAITTHILDTSTGRPAAGIAVTLEVQLDGEDWKLLGRSISGSDGRAGELLPKGSALQPGAYRLEFDTAGYFRAQGHECFYPYVRVVFTVDDADRHYHVPLLVSPYGYTTYRGS